jgi:hypothetical protein
LFLSAVKRIDKRHPNQSNDRINKDIHQFRRAVGPELKHRRVEEKIPEYVATDRHDHRRTNPAPPGGNQRRRNEKQIRRAWTKERRQSGMRSRERFSRQILGKALHEVFNNFQNPKSKASPVPSDRGGL